MRTLPLLLALLLACDSAPTEAPSASPTIEPSPAAKAEKADKAPRDDTPPERSPLPAAVPVEGYPTLAIVGHGVRLELAPPFQAAVMPTPDNIASHGDMLIVSWWDVTEPGAGRNGIKGLHNARVVPGLAVEGAVPTPGVSGEGRRERAVLTVGEDGTRVELPKGVSELGGMMKVSAGPTEAGWAVLVDGAEPVPFPETRELLHSNDPATGAAFAFEKVPRKPWGPWVEAAQEPPQP